MTYRFMDCELVTKDSTLDGEMPPFAIEGVLHRAVTLWYGQTGAGKSQLVTSMAAAIASGATEWLGQPIAKEWQGQPVAIVCGDPDSRLEYKERLISINDELKDGKVWLYSPYRPTQPEGWEEVRQAVMASNAKLVVVDNLSQFVPGSTSDDVAVKLLYAETDKFSRDGVAVLMIAHVSEKPTENGPSRLNATYRKLIMLRG